MTAAVLPFPYAQRTKLNALEARLETLQKQHAELHSAIFAVRHLPGDFFTLEETNEGMVRAPGDIGGKGLAAGMWVPHLAGLIRQYTAENSSPETIVAGVNRDFARLASLAPLSSLFVARLDRDSGTVAYCSAGHPPALLLRADGELEELSEGGPVLVVVPAARSEEHTSGLQSLAYL